jgi:putative LysE/RhtB family amino acid efflux pump
MRAGVAAPSRLRSQAGCVRVYPRCQRRGRVVRRITRVLVAATPITGLRLGLGLLGAAVLTILGARALRNATRAGNQAEPSTAITSAPRAYLTALSGTAANPLTIASWAAIFAAASAAHISRTTTGAVLLLAGIGLGTATWFTTLSTAMTLVRRLAGRHIHQAIDVISGLGLIGFGILLAWHTTAAASR